jgi:hypothetical protein
VTKFSQDRSGKGRVNFRVGLGRLRQDTVPNRK